MKQVVIGVDIGGTFTKFGLVDREGNLICKGSMATDIYDNVVDYQKALYESIEQVIMPLKGTIEIKGAGFGAQTEIIIRALSNTLQT